jgi:hypothetical protein
MTKTFKKFEFTPTEWATLQKDIQQTTTTPSGETVTTWKDCAVVEIGFIVITPAVYDGVELKTPAVLSDKWAVDILFYTEPPAEFTPFEVWPNPMGIHTFSGDDSLYLKGYCAKFPESDYCKLPEPVITNEAL